jgi:hypothetical protein
MYINECTFDLLKLPNYSRMRDIGSPFSKLPIELEEEFTLTEISRTSGSLNWDQ